MRYLSAGESHGPALTVIIEGLPAGLMIDTEFVEANLANRQKGFGRGQRMKIESDKLQIISGLWKRKTIGSPLTILIANRDWENWKDKARNSGTIPRPGHADLPGLLKYNYDDIQLVIERASARETAAKVAAGSIARLYLDAFGVKIVGHTIAIGGIKINKAPNNYQRLKKLVEDSELRCADGAAAKQMKRVIMAAIKRGDTLGGIVEVRAYDVPPGIGSYVQWDRRLDGSLAQALMAIPSIKAVELGNGIANAVLPGRAVHDEIFFSRANGYFRKTNLAGGIEGGMSNGETIIARAYLKPISTLKRPLRSVDTSTQKQVPAPYVRSDTVVVPAASVVAEAAIAWTLATAFNEKFGGDSMKEALRNFKGYLSQFKKR